MTMNKNTTMLSAVVITTMLLSASILYAPAFNLSSVNLPGIFNSAFASGNTHEINLSVESLPNGQFAYKMLNHTRNGQDVTGYEAQATIPGPTLVVTEGDTVRVIVTNNLAEGGPAVGFTVDGIAIANEGETLAGGVDNVMAYSFTAPSGGNTYIYKDNGSDLLGLFGAIIVEKNDGSVQSFVDGNTGKITPANKDELHKEFVLFMVGSTFWGQEISSEGTQTALWTNPMLVVTQGNLVRFHVLSIGMGHTFHLHAHRWVEPGTSAIIDTKLMETPEDNHVFTVIAGDQVGAGDWQYHCHVFAHMEAGMHGIFRVLPSDSTDSETSQAGASPYGGHPVLANGNIPGLATFEITDEPGSWFKNTLDISAITKTRSLALIKPGDSVNFIMSNTNTVHTITSLLWPTGAAHMPMDEVQSYKGGGIVQLMDPGLYVFTCKVHPYMFGAVIVDDLSTGPSNGLDNSAIGESLDLGGSLTLVSDPEGSFPTASDLGLRLLKTFFVATTPANWKDYRQSEWNPSYPPVNVRAGNLEVGTDLFADRPGGGGLNGLIDYYFGENETKSLADQIQLPATPGVGEVWVDTQFETTQEKDKPGTATAVDAANWEIIKKVSLGMNNPHNMWTDANQEVIYQTEWFDNKLTTFNRDTGSLVDQMVVGEAPSHVMTRTDNGDIHVALNGEEGVAEIKATTDPTTVNRIIPMQGLGQDPTHPHAHWMSADGQKMVTPNEFTGDTTIYGFDTEHIEAKTPTGHTAIAVGMMPDSSKYYVANLLSNSLSVIDMSDGHKIKDINLLADYNPVSIDLSHPGGWLSAIDLTSGPLVVGALPIQTPVSPDGKYAVTANTLSGTITITDTNTDEVVTTMFCEPGCHGVQFGAKQGGGYYAYVSSKFANDLIVIDMDSLTIAGKILLTSTTDTQSDETVKDGYYAGMGGQGVLPVPVVYNGWVQNIPESVLEQNAWELTCDQRNPINPENCPS